MKRILVIGSRDSGSKNNPEVIAQALVGKGVETKVVFWEELQFTIETDTVEITDGSGMELRHYSPEMVLAFGWYKNGTQSIYRDIAFSVATYLDAHTIPYWNSEMGNQRSTSKLSCMVQLALEGVSVPRTKFSLDQSYIEQENYPFIAKAVSASRGNENHLLRSSEDQQKLTTGKVRYLVQEFLENDHDLRVICFDGKPERILRRSRQDAKETHLNNVSQGGSGEWIALSDVPAELLTISQKICKIMGREMAGIDFIPNDSSPYRYSCLEVNAIPQLTSGHDADVKIQQLVTAIEGK